MKQTKDKFKTFKHVFDDFTERNLFKLSSKGYFDELESPIRMGKEANIFIAKKGDKKVIIKIYRLSTCDFFKMFEYIRPDPRFKVEKNRRKVIFAWAKREYSNLLRSRSKGIRVPTPYGYLYNISAVPAALGATRNLRALLSVSVEAVKDVPLLE